MFAADCVLIVQIVPWHLLCIYMWLYIKEMPAGSTAFQCCEITSVPMDVHYWMSSILTVSDVTLRLQQLMWEDNNLSTGHAQGWVICILPSLTWTVSTLPDAVLTVSCWGRTAGPEVDSHSIGTAEGRRKGMSEGLVWVSNLHVDKVSTRYNITQYLLQLYNINQKEHNTLCSVWSWHYCWVKDSSIFMISHITWSYCKYKYVRWPWKVLRQKSLSIRNYDS